MKLQAAFEELVEQFGLPLLLGVDARVSRPIGPGALSHFKLAKPSNGEVEDALTEAIAIQTRALAHGVRPAELSGDNVTLLLASHNFAALLDSSLESWPASSAKKTITQWIEHSLDDVALPQTEGDALLRHLIVHALLSAARVDVALSNWGGTRTYRGRPAPAEPVLPRFRYSRTESKTTLISAFADSNAVAGAHELLRRLIAVSPFTEIVRSHTLGEFQFSVATLAVLRSNALSDAACRWMVDVGLEAYAERWMPALRMLADVRQDEALVVARFLRKAFVLHSLAGKSIANPSSAAIELVAIGSQLLNASSDADLALSRTDRSLVRAAVENHRRTLPRDAFVATHPILVRATQPPLTENRS